MGPSFYIWLARGAERLAPLPPVTYTTGFTAISSHCLAALPAKMSAFNGYMW